MAWATDDKRSIQLSSPRDASSTAEIGDDRSIHACGNHVDGGGGQGPRVSIGEKHPGVASRAAEFRNCSVQSHSSDAFDLVDHRRDSGPRRGQVVGPKPMKAEPLHAFLDMNDQFDLGLGLFIDPGPNGIHVPVCEHRIIHPNHKQAGVVPVTSQRAHNPNTPVPHRRRPSSAGQRVYAAHHKTKEVDLSISHVYHVVQLCPPQGLERHALPCGQGHGGVGDTIIAALEKLGEQLFPGPPGELFLLLVVPVGGPVSVIKGEYDRENRVSHPSLILVPLGVILPDQVGAGVGDTGEPGTCNPTPVRVELGQPEWGGRAQPNPAQARQAFSRLDESQLDVDPAGLCKDEGGQLFLVGCREAAEVYAMDEHEGEGAFGLTRVGSREGEGAEDARGDGAPAALLVEAGEAEAESEGGVGDRVARGVCECGNVRQGGESGAGVGVWEGQKPCGQIPECWGP